MKWQILNELHLYSYFSRYFPLVSASLNAASSKLYVGNCIMRNSVEAGMKWTSSCQHLLYCYAVLIVILSCSLNEFRAATSVCTGVWLLWFRKECHGVVQPHRSKWCPPASGPAGAKEAAYQATDERLHDLVEGGKKEDLKRKPRDAQLADQQRTRSVCQLLSKL